MELYYLWIIILITGIIFELYNLVIIKNKKKSTWIWIVFFTFGFLLAVNRLSEEQKLNDIEYANRIFGKLLYMK
jgi:hypothetical protein